jgi:hypothetical protein
LISEWLLWLICWHACLCLFRLQVRAVPKEGGPSRGETGSMRCSSVATSGFAVSYFASCRCAVTKFEILPTLLNASRCFNKTF